MDKEVENTPTLTTERLVLRRWRESDAEAAHELLSDEVVNRFLPWWPTASVEDARNFINERFLSVYSRPAGYCYAVCLKDTDTPIGYVNADWHKAHDLGYAISRPYQNQGLITEASKAVLEQVKKDEVFDFVTATHDRENPASGAVMNKLGMTYKYSYEERWQPKNKMVIFRLYQLNITSSVALNYDEYWKLYPNHFVEDVGQNYFA